MSAQLIRLQEQYAAARRRGGHAGVDAALALAWQLRLTDLPRALELAQEARADAEAQGYRAGQAQGRAVLGRLHWQSSDLAAARTESEAALDTFRHLQDLAGQSLAVSTLGCVLMSAGDLNGALELQRQALELATQAGDQPGKAACLRFIGDVRRNLGQGDQALESYTESLQICRSTDDAYATAAVLRSIANVYSDRGDFNLALEHYQQALTLARQAGSSWLEAQCLNGIGVWQVERGEYAQALDNYREVLRINESSGNRSGHAISLHNIGAVYIRIGDYDSALPYFAGAAVLFEDLGEDMQLANSLQGIGDIYRHMNDTGQALKHLERSLQIAQNAGYAEGEGRALNMIGEVWQQRGDLTAAINHYHRSLDVLQQIGNQRLAAQTLHQLGEAYHLSGYNVQALQHFRESLRISDGLGVKYYQALTPIRCAAVFTDQGRIQDALEWLDKALPLAREQESTSLMYQAHQAYAAAYAASGDAAKALEHYTAFHELKEQVFNENADRRIKTVAVQYQVERKEREAELHRLKNVELVRLNQELTEANRVKNEFLRIAAHDLKNPLTGIRLMSELITRENPAGLPTWKLSGRIEAETTRMLDIVNKLLQVAKTETGAIRIVSQPVDVCALTADVADSNRGQAVRKGQTIDCTAVPDYPLVVSGDPGWLREAIDNLVSNAVKYSPPDAVITIQVVKELQSVRINVADQGPGLTEQDRKDLFGAFRRLSALPTGGESSTGLGLSIARQLVDMHGGSIGADNLPERGCRFYITLPLHSPAPAANALTEPPESSPGPA